MENENDDIAGTVQNANGMHGTVPFDSAGDLVSRSEWRVALAERFLLWPLVPDSSALLRAQWAQKNGRPAKTGRAVLSY